MRAVNLIAPQQSLARSRGRSNGAALAIVGLIAGLAILALLYGIAHRQVSSRRGEAATLSSQVQVARAHAAQLAPYTSFASLREQRVGAVTSLVDTRFDWAHVMHEIGRVLPQGTSISTLDGSMAASAAPATATPAATTSAGSVTSATPAGSVPSLKLTGCATSQSGVAETLDRLRLIDGVEEVKLESSTKAGSSGASSGSGGCPTTFNATVAFDGLPASPTEGSR